MIFFDLLHAQAIGLYALLIICSFENQRWGRSQSYSSSLEAELVENTGLIAMFCQYGFCVAYGWDVSIWSALVLFFSGIVITQIYVLLVGLIAPGDHRVIWIVSSFSIYPVAFLFASKLTWFGLFPEAEFAVH